MWLYISFQLKGASQGKACAIHYHSEMFLGLGINTDQVLHKKAKPAWVEPTQYTTNKNWWRILPLKEGLGL